MSYHIYTLPYAIISHLRFDWFDNCSSNNAQKGLSYILMIKWFLSSIIKLLLGEFDILVRVSIVFFGLIDNKQ